MKTSFSFTLRSLYPRYLLLRESVCICWQRANRLYFTLCVTGASLSALLGAVTRYPSPVLSGLRNEAGIAFNAIEEEPAAAAEASTGRCLETVDPWTPCLCHLEMCIGWYPCGLKYCKGKSDGKVGSVGGSYRCGIKTCKKCSLFSYYVRQKQLCLWDEWPRAHSWRKRVPWQWFSSRCLCVLHAADFCSSFSY